MANGQYHAKHQKKRRYGVKIKNPLRLPVIARVRSETGAIRMGAMDGKEVHRTISPGDEIFVSTKGSCELDIEFNVIKFDEVGNIIDVGKADGRHIDHHDSLPTKVQRAPAIRAIEFKETKDIDGDFEWHPIAEWPLSPAKEGRLLAVSCVIQSMEPEARGRVLVVTAADDVAKATRLTPKPLTQSTTLEFKKETMVPAGHRVLILGKSKGGIIRFTGVIKGEEFPAVARMPTRVTEEKKRQPVEGEKVEIRSLGDILKDHAKEEVAV